MRTVVEQRMEPEEVVGKGHRGHPAWQQVGTSQRQIRSEITGPKQPLKNPGGRWLLEIWKFGALSNLHVIIKPTLRVALNNSVVSAISLQCVSLGYKGRGAGSAQAGCCCLAL